MRRRENRGFLFRNADGAVLAELIVSFSLTAILMCSAVFILASGLRAFQRIQAGVYAELVSELLLGKISEEIAAAAPGCTASGSNWNFLVGNMDDRVQPSSDAPDLPAASWLAFEDRHGTPAAIYASEGEDGAARGSGYLYIRYYAYGGEEGQAPEEIHWHFDPEIYMGFRISRLLFSQPDPEKRNVFRIDLELEQEQTGWRHASFCYIKNYNLAEDSSAVLAGQGEREPENVHALAHER